MGFFPQAKQIGMIIGKTLSMNRPLVIALVTLLLMIQTQKISHWGHPAIAKAQNVDSQSLPKIHQLPPRLINWKATKDKSDYFQAINPLPIGHLIWSDRPVSVYVGPSHFSDPSRRQAWEKSVNGAIADWQAYFPLKRINQPNADIVIEQVRPKRTSKGRIRSAQATPEAFCSGDRLAHRFTIQISPSQTARYIKAATRHELGHALGIWGHSNNPQDVMYQSQVSDPPKISERDINTLKKIYKQPTLLGWPAPQYCRAISVTP